MANEHKIDVNKRDYLGKKGVKQLRKDGNIPGIYYSQNSDISTPISISNYEFQEALKSGARIFNISVGGKKQNVLFKSVQYHPVTDEILHIDLYGIDMNKPINIGIPINLIGNAIGVTEEGGILNQASNEIEIQCLPADIPEMIELDISELNLGSSMNATNIKLDEKFTLITPEDTVIVSVTQAMQEIEADTVSEDDELFMDEDGEQTGTEETTSESESSKSDEKDSNSE